MLEFTEEELDFIHMIANKYCSRIVYNADATTDIDWLIQNLNMSRNIAKKIGVYLNKSDEVSINVDES